MATIADTIAKFETDVEIVHGVAHGPSSGEGSLVTTEGGQLKTLAKVLADADAEVTASVGLRTDLASTASDKGSALIAHGSQTVAQALDARLPEIATYAALRAYTGPLTAFYVRGVASLFDGGAGVFRVDASDTTSADNGGTILVDVVGRRWKRIDTWGVRPSWFGAVCNGVIDDTAAALAAHTFANSIGARISYEGIQKIALQANAQIPIKTSTDFAGCELVILGGVQTPPSWDSGAFSTCFVVSDDDAPLVTTTGAVSAADLLQGSRTPTKGLFNGHGFALLECAYQVPNRTKDGTQNYKQAFKVNRNGVVSEPLSVDLQAHAAAITVTYRKTSKRRLTVENLALTEGAWNNQRVLRIERCNVSVNGFSFLHETEGTFDNVCAIIDVVCASDITINDFVTTGRPVTANVGSYCLQIGGGADIFVNRMNAITGWGATGTNNVNGLHFNDCVLNRVDVHSSGHNIYVTGGALHDFGVFYGWGGGRIQLSNVNLYNCPGVTGRDDYGGSFFGAIEIDGATVSAPNTWTYTLVSLAKLGASTPVYMPNLVINNVTRINSTNGGNAPLRVILAQVFNAAYVVYVPQFIDIREIRCTTPWRFACEIDYLSMEKHPAIFDTLLRIRAARSNAVATNETGVLDRAAIRTPSVYPNLVMEVSDCEHFAARVRIPNKMQIQLNNVGVNALIVDTTAATQPVVVLDACRLLNHATGHAGTPLVGGKTSGSTGFTLMRDCLIGPTSPGFDLSEVAAFMGCIIRLGTTQPTLPAEVTAALAFSGWRKSGMFS